MTTWKDFEFEDLSVELTLENQQVRMGLLKCQHKKNGFQNHFLLPPGSDGGRRSLAAPGMVLGLSTLPTSPPLQLSRCHCRAIPGRLPPPHAVVHKPTYISISRPLCAPSDYSSAAASEMELLPISQLNFPRGHHLSPGTFSLTTLIFPLPLEGPKHPPSGFTSHIS